MSSHFFRVSKRIKTAIRTGIPAVVATILLTNSVQAQPARTGTNTKSKAIPSEVLMLQEPDEVETIRKLLVNGRKNDALKAAEKYIEKVDRTALRHETLPKYYAWNAYCTVLTSLQRIEEAIGACSMAMEYEPGKWSAVNNRGTAKFVGGMLDQALADYQKAMTMVSRENLSARETIQHNITLLEARQ